MGCHTWFYKPGRKVTGIGHSSRVNNKWFVSDETTPFDIFRISPSRDAGYPSDMLWSVEECLKYIEDNKDKIYRGDLNYLNKDEPNIDLVNVTFKLMKAFEQFPGGFITFG